MISLSGEAASPVSLYSIGSVSSLFAVDFGSREVPTSRMISTPKILAMSQDYQIAPVHQELNLINSVRDAKVLLI
jgi:hypothetical protein